MRLPEPGAPPSGIISPVTRFASSAETSRVWAAREASTRASPMILPSSKVMVLARSSLRS